MSATIKSDHLACYTEDIGCSADGSGQSTASIGSFADGFTIITASTSS
jgi:hypothetical protein